MPFLIILLENPSIAYLSSIFEMRILITLKLFIILNKKMNFFQLLISSIIVNMFECYFKKVVYLKNDLLGAELTDKNLRRTKEFRFNFKLLSLGFLISTCWFYLICDRLEFHFIDDSM